MITKYGYDVFFSIAALCVVILVLTLLFIEPKLYRYSMIVVTLAVLGFTMNFFRDPDRIVPGGDYCVLAPADGTVVVVKNVVDNEFFHAGGPANQYFYVAAECPCQSQSYFRIGKTYQVRSRKVLCSV